MQFLRAAAVVGLCGLACLVWALLDPRPIPVVFAMSVGQGLGATSLLLYVVVVLSEVRRAPPPPPDPHDPPDPADGAGAS